MMILETVVALLCVAILVAAQLATQREDKNGKAGKGRDKATGWRRRSTRSYINQLEISLRKKGEQVRNLVVECNMAHEATKALDDALKFANQVRLVLVTLVVCEMISLVGVVLYGVYTRGGV